MNRTKSQSGKMAATKTYARCAYESPMGTITLAAGEDGLKGLWFDGQRYYGGTLDAPMEQGGNEFGINSVHCSVFPVSYFTKRGYIVRRLATLG